MTRKILLFLSVGLMAFALIYLPTFSINEVAAVRHATRIGCEQRVDFAGTLANGNEMALRLSIYLALAQTAIAISLYFLKRRSDRDQNN